MEGLNDLRVRLWDEMAGQYQLSHGYDMSWLAPIRLVTRPSKFLLMLELPPGTARQNIDVGHSACQILPSDDHNFESTVATAWCCSQKLRANSMK